MSDEAEITPSSGNVYADAGLPHPEARLAKAHLLRVLRRLIQDNGWTQAEAAKVLGLDQPKISAIMHGRTAGFSIDRLLQLLVEANYDVNITIAPASASAKRAEIRVNAMTGTSQANDVTPRDTIPAPYGEVTSATGK